MVVRMLGPEDREWDELLARLPHDVYHTSGYAAACAIVEPHDIRLAVVEAEDDLLLAPLLVRRVPARSGGDPGRVDFASPYGYPTPVCSSCGERTQTTLLQELIGHLAALGGVSAFFRSHPFLGLARGAWEHVGDVVLHGRTVYVDVAAVAPDPMASFRGGHRRQISTLEQLGYRAESQRWDLYTQFPEVYRENMRRVDVPRYLHFSDEYFATIRGRLPGNVRYLTVTAPSGELAAAAIMLMCGDMAQYHLSATVAAYLKDAPGKVLFPLMIREAADAGARILHLGGGRGGRADSLFEFKRGFSRLCADYSSYRVILDAGAYRALSAGSLAPDGFFPAYRYELEG